MPQWAGTQQNVIPVPVWLIKIMQNLKKKINKNILIGKVQFVIESDCHMESNWNKFKSANNSK